MTPRARWLPVRWARWVRSWTVLSALLASLASFASSASAAFEYDERVGLAVMTEQGLCLSIPRPDLAEGQLLDLIAMPPVGSPGRPRVLEARIDVRYDECPGFPGEEREPRYVLKLTEGIALIGEVLFAIDRPAGEWDLEPNAVTRDLNGDRKPESFHVCAGTDGLHLTIWSGEPRKGLRQWHRYHDLGHAVEPTCKGGDLPKQAP